MNEKKNCVPPWVSDERIAPTFVNSGFTNRTKWEKENKGEKRGFLKRTAEETEARRALRDFQRDYMWEHLDERAGDND